MEHLKRNTQNSRPFGKKWTFFFFFDFMILKSENVLQDVVFTFECWVESFGLFTCDDAAPLWSPVLEKAVMLGVYH